MELTPRSSCGARPRRGLGLFVTSAAPALLQALRPGEAALLARIEAGALEVPVLPEAAAQILTETARDDWHATVIVECLRRDPTLAANLLRLCNSAAFRGASPVVSLHQAVARLGASQLRQLALAIACETRVFRVPGFEGVVHAVFQHSLTTALVAREIARLRRANLEEAFLSGLLHDVGWPLVLQLAVELHLEKQKAEVYRVARRTHAFLARRLAHEWRLPARVADAIEHHHALAWSGASAEAAATLALADCLAHCAQYDSDPEPVRLHPALPVLNLYPDAVEGLLAAAPKLFAEAAQS